MASKKKILKYTGVSLLVLLILLLILLPTLVKNYAIKNSKELLGRQIDMDKLRMNYFTGTVKVYNCSDGVRIISACRATLRRKSSRWAR